MLFNLRVISGWASTATQYITFIHSETCSKYNLESKGYIRLCKDEKTMIVYFASNDDIPKDTIMIDSRTHALTLYVANGEMVTCENIVEAMKSTKITVRLRKGGVINYPQLGKPLYVAPGYYVLCPEGLGIVETGQGLYQYNRDDVMSVLLGSGNISREEALTISEVTPTTINIDFCNMGIGGLREQMNTLIRKVLISRIIPQSMREQYDVKDIKGILLHGPPGTGKTLIARNIGKIIPNAVITEVNGSEFVGETESNIRNIFDKSKTSPNKVHVIIFDKIDAVCKRRDASSHDDKALIQLLTMIDGLDSANNVLIIGITNRKDVIDPALTRSGRLECHIEIPLPTETGRREILDIFLNPMRVKKLAENIDSNFWARTLDGYSGADIESLIGRSKNLALLRNCGIDNNVIKPCDEKTRSAHITNDDLLDAFNSFQPTFSKNDDMVQRYIANYPLGNPETLTSHIKDVKIALASTMKKPYVIYRVPSATHDPIPEQYVKEEERGRACHLACSLGLPYIRYVTYNNFLGKTSAQNCEILNDAYINCLQAERAVLILDSLSDVEDRTLILREKFIMNNPLTKGKQLIIIHLSDSTII